MTEERAIPECIDVIKSLLDDVSELEGWYKQRPKDGITEALEALEIIENHFNRVDAIAKEVRNIIIDVPWDKQGVKNA